MNNNIARPKKLNSTELAKLLTAPQAQIYELNATNAVPTVAKVVGKIRSRECYYLVSTRK
jgi:hypothetical protein